MTVAFVADSRNWDGDGRAWWIASWFLGLAAATALLVTMFALWRRQRGLGVAGTLGIVVTGAAGVAFFAAAWAPLVWSSLLAVGVGLFAVALLRAGSLRATPVVLFGVGWPIAVAFAWIAAIVGDGWWLDFTEQRGIFPFAFTIAVAVFAIGLVQIGRRTTEHQPT